MPLHEEDFSGGLVTVRDPATLNPGQLVQADNAVYLPDDTGIHKARLRTKYNAVAAGAAGNIKGLRYMEFENSLAILAAHEASSIHLSSFSAETGTFATLTPITGVGSGSTLDTVHFANRYVTLNGIGANQIVRPDGTFRRQGLNPVTDMGTRPTIGSGVFNASLGTGFFFFLTTEVFIDTASGEEIESSFEGTPKTATTGLTSPTTQAYTVTQPTVVNSGIATHWRVYMSPRQDAETPIPNLNEFRLVAESAIETTSVVIGNKTGMNSVLPGTTVTSGWTTSDNIKTDNNVGATTSTNLSTLTATNFGITGLSGTITGIEVQLKLRLTNYTALLDRPGLRLDLTTDAGSTLFPNNTSRTIPLLHIAGVTANFVTVFGGGNTDLWARTGSPAWPLADINSNTNFGVRLRYDTLFESPFGGLPLIEVDFVKIAVYTTGSAQPVDLSGKPYRVVNVSVAGITTTYSADGPPPIATTGDIFEGQLVLDDIQDKSMIRYSLPDSTESFPSIYFLNFETKVQDVVKCIRRLGNKLIVGMDHQLYRVNYLPRETDAEFDRGRAYEAISESSGIVGPQAATLFSPDGATLLLAYISNQGPRYTDGFQAKSLNGDLDWDALVRIPSASDVVNYLDDSILVDYPFLEQLWFYYTAPGSTTNNRAVVFHYGSEHRREDGTFRATGPITVAAFSATNARLAGNDLLLTGQSGGFVYVEDRGYTDASGGSPLFAVRTREMYLAGIGNEARVEKVYTRHRQDATSTVTITPYARRQDAAQFSIATKTFTTAQEGTSENAIDLAGDSHQFKFEEVSNGGFGIRLTNYGLLVAEQGLTEKR